MNSVLYISQLNEKGIVHPSEYRLTYSQIVLGLLDKPLSVKEIIPQVNFSAPTVRKTLQELYKSKKITRSGTPNKRIYQKID